MEIELSFLVPNIFVNRNGPPYLIDHRYIQLFPQIRSSNIPLSIEAEVDEGRLASVGCSVWTIRIQALLSVTNQISLMNDALASLFLHNLLQTRHPFTYAFWTIMRSLLHTDRRHCGEGQDLCRSAAPAVEVDEYTMVLCYCNTCSLQAWTGNSPSLFWQ